MEQNNTLSQAQANNAIFVWSNVWPCYNDRMAAMNRWTNVWLAVTFAESLTLVEKE